MALDLQEKESHNVGQFPLEMISPKVGKPSSEFTYSTAPWASLVGHHERSNCGKHGAVS